MLRFLDVHEMGLPAEAASHLAHLRVTSRVRMPDCCVLLSALDEGARVASFDLQLNRAAEELGLTVVSA